MNCPTFEQPGKNPTCVDYVALNQKGHEIVMTCKTRDEIYTTSNHHLIEITANSTLLNMTLLPKRKKKIPVWRLKHENRRNLYQKLLKEQWTKLEDVEFDDPSRCYKAY